MVLSIRPPPGPKRFRTLRRRYVAFTSVVDHPHVANDVLLSLKSGNFILDKNAATPGHVDGFNFLITL